MVPRKPSSQVTLTGGRPEDSWTGRLAAALRDRGFNAEGPSPVFHLSVGEKQQVRKPDFAVYDGVIHIGSAKVGSRQEVQSLTTAQEYSQQIPLTKELTGKSLGEVFAVTYPGRGEKNFILHILARSGGVWNQNLARHCSSMLLEVLAGADPSQ